LIEKSRTLARDFSFGALISKLMATLKGCSAIRLFNQVPHKKEVIKETIWGTNHLALLQVQYHSMSETCFERANLLPQYKVMSHPHYLFFKVKGEDFLYRVPAS
jgi:thioredoxin-related protein